MILTKSRTFFLLLLVATLFSNLEAQTNSTFRIVGYYSGPTNLIDSFEMGKLTHLIFSFGHLKDNRLWINSAEDSTQIKKMVALKSKHPDLKVMLSLGGWGGCETCSDVFNTANGRHEFAQSVKEISAYFHTDGIDLDWEYPAIDGFPGHTFRVEDKDNFTSLVKELRKVNSEDFEISFAAGGFTSYIDSSIDWKEVIKYTDFINIMTYDLVHGFSTVSGHHTPLYSTPQQTESTDHAVQMLLKAGVPAEQLVIGAAFYGRFFHITEGNRVDLYMPCRFSHGFSFKYANDSLSVKNGFVKLWDDVAKAPFAINTIERLVATYDDKQSITLKTKYAVDKKLGGIMFWQLADDKIRDGLLETMFRNKYHNQK
ncbi:MAG TPA: glycosyl hydrolase family 18 protein [Saprospiraceae bacterium]|nr:glycosyl hydrolase family 18 protein [Saprospiraceae bacterium]